jgi:hypothetical protein
MEELTRLAGVLDTAKQFEHWMLSTFKIGRGLGAVADFVADVNSRFAYKRRQSILATARQMVRSHDREFLPLCVPPPLHTQTRFLSAALFIAFFSAFRAMCSHTPVTSRWALCVGWCRTCACTVCRRVPQLQPGP